MIGFPPFWKGSKVRLRIVDVEQLLAEDDDAGGSLRLTRLKRTATTPGTVLCAPLPGAWNDTRERYANRNSDSLAVLPMYRAFLNDAITSQAQLAITPEYSVPWGLIAEIIDGTPRPPKGSLWVLGCESIAFSELDALRIAANSTTGVCMIHESLEPQQEAQTAFVRTRWSLSSGRSTLPVPTCCVSWCSSRPSPRETQTTWSFSRFILVQTSTSSPPIPRCFSASVDMFRRI